MQRVFECQLEDARAVDGRAADGQPAAAVVGSASDEGDASTKPSFALTSRENAAADGPEVQPALPAPPDDARAVDGPAADDQPAAVPDGASDEGDDST